MNPPKLGPATQSKLIDAVSRGASWLDCSRLLGYSSPEALHHALDAKPDVKTRVHQAKAEANLRMLDLLRTGEANAIQEKFFRRTARDPGYRDIDAVAKDGDNAEELGNKLLDVLNNLPIQNKEPKNGNNP